MCVCVQMCHVLQYLCDCQVRHRIEALVAFSDDFVACLQDNQRFRYNEVMLALNMSAALTAKKTKEFRSPPQEQVGTLQWRPVKAGTTDLVDVCMMSISNKCIVTKNTSSRYSCSMDIDFFFIFLVHWS